MSDSTLLLSNILIGLFEGADATYAFLEQDWKTHFDGDTDAPINSTVVTKTHVINVDDIVERYSGTAQDGKFERIFVVSSTRGEAHIDDKYCDVTNPQYIRFVLCLDYNDFTYKQPAGMAKRILRPTTIGRGILVLIFGGVFLNIGVQILTSIGISIITREPKPSYVIDERDRILELRAVRVSYTIIGTKIYISTSVYPMLLCFCY